MMGESHAVGMPFSKCIDEPESLLRELDGWLRGRRWFASKSSGGPLELRDHYVMACEDCTVLSMLIRHDDDGWHEEYFVPLALSRTDDGEGCTVVEAEDLDGYLHYVFSSIEKGHGVKTHEGGFISFEPMRLPFVPDSFQCIDQDTSNCLRLGVKGNLKAVLKAYRKLDPDSPEVELLRRLDADAVPRMVGAWRYSRGGEPVPLGIVTKYVEGMDAGAHFSALLNEYLDTGWGDEGRESARALGKAVAGLHSALAALSGPDFCVEDTTDGDCVGWIAEAREGLDWCLGKARGADRIRLNGMRDEVHSALEQLGSCSGEAKMRTHQDLHLSQTLTVDGRAFSFLDWEGEPGRHGKERWEKLPPMRDLATMARSFSYLACSHCEGSDERRERSAEWETAMLDEMLYGYFEDPPVEITPGKRVEMLNGWMVQKALYELRYELNNRPKWAWIPIAGLRALVGGSP